MRRKLYLPLILAFIYLIILGFIIKTLVRILGPSFGWLFGIFLTAGLTFAGIVLRPFREWVEEVYAELLSGKSKAYKVCLFGRGGTGKTTLIKSLFLIVGSPIPQKVTESFDYYQNKVFFSLESLKKGESLDIAIADYKGQKASQLVKVPRELLDDLDRPEINSLLFLVDLVPRKLDESGLPIRDEDLLDILRVNTIQKIRGRVEENYSYIGECMIETVFEFLYSRNLKSVKLIITKIDLFKKLIEDGYINLVNGLTIFVTFLTHTFTLKQHLEASGLGGSTTI